MHLTDREYEHWLVSLSLDQVLGLFREHSATELLCKVLPRNANSKNQVYLAPDIGQLGKIPSGSITTIPSASAKSSGREGPIFRSSVSLSWITPDGTLAPVRGTKLIAYPQFPEVRLSGFLQGCSQSPSFLFNPDKRGLVPDRLLFLGPRADGTILALALPPEAEAAKEFRKNSYDMYGLFSIIPLHEYQAGSGLFMLLDELFRIHHLEWVPSLRLNKDGQRVPCIVNNCGGYTLEAQLGIRTNGISEPDFHGWEVKSRLVTNILKPGASRVTLFTPEPDGGAYASKGAEYFIRTWGYPDKKGRADRINFGGIYRCGREFHRDTDVRLELDGYDSASDKFDSEGAIRLIDSKGVEAASWSFVKLMEHWKRKHAHAAYVPCQGRVKQGRQYCYADTVMLGEGAEFRRFLKAVANGLIYYDPGIKLEHAAGNASIVKLRSQIRVGSRDLLALYQSTCIVPVDRSRR